MTQGHGMTFEHINVEEAVKKAKYLLETEINISPALKASIELLLLLISILVNRIGLNSKNSSKPPSMDLDREKKLKPKGDRKAGGQTGHEGKTLRKVENPDVIKEIPVDRNKLPVAPYHQAGY